MKRYEDYNEKRKSMSYKIETLISIASLKKKLTAANIIYTRKGMFIYIHPNDVEKWLSIKKH